MRVGWTRPRRFASRLPGSYLDLTLMQCNAPHYSSILWGLGQVWEDMELIEDRNPQGTGHGTIGPPDNALYTKRGNTRMELVRKKIV